MAAICTIRLSERTVGSQPAKASSILAWCTMENKIRLVVAWGFEVNNDLPVWNHKNPHGLSRNPLSVDDAFELIISMLVSLQPLLDEVR